jgi:hypothetical protein
MLDLIGKPLQIDCFDLLAALPAEALCGCLARVAGCGPGQLRSQADVENHLRMQLPTAIECD